MKLHQIMISTVVMLFLQITLRTIFDSPSHAIKIYLLLNIYIYLRLTYFLLKERPRLLTLTFALFKNPFYFNIIEKTKTLVIKIWIHFDGLPNGVISLAAMCFLCFKCSQFSIPRLFLPLTSLILFLLLQNIF